MKLTPAILGNDDLLQEWQNNACLHPFKHKIFDQHLGCFRELLLDCGSCENCLIKRSTDWYVRLYLHAASYDYCYMVNLDYAPFYKPYKQMTDAEKKSLRHLKDALWFWDDENKNKTYCLSPCVVCYKHFQDYMKRLRKALPEHDITYYIRCEYGSKYGRPHAHLIVFSDKPISLEFQDAWTLFGRPIGQAEVYDLKENGTLCPDKANPNYSANYCFRYVAKYLNKTQNFNTNRLYHAYVLLIFHNHYNFEKVSRKMVAEMRAYITQKCDGKNLPNFGEFCRIFKPLNRCSTRKSIGSVYLRENMHRFLEGNMAVTLPDGSAATCPAYFFRKVQEQKFPFRIVRRSLKGVSQTVPNHTNLLDTFDGRIETILRDYCTAVRIDPLVSVGDTIGISKNTYRPPITAPYRTYSTQALYDLARGCYVDIHFFDGDTTPFIVGSKRNGEIVYLIKYEDFRTWYKESWEMMKKERALSDARQRSLISTYVQLSADKLLKLRDMAELRIAEHRRLYQITRSRCANLE